MPGHDHTPGARRQKPQRKDEGGFFRRPGVEPVPHGGEPAISVFRTSCASLMSAAGPVWEGTDWVMGKRP